MTDTLLVIGAQKSGTSTMVGILNCHPEIFVAHEWFLDSVCTKYGLDFFRHYRVDERERLKKKKPIASSFQNFIRVLLKNGYNYKYAGDKWPRIGSYKVIDKRIVEMKDIYSIFMIRDLRTWLQHKMVLNIYKCTDDITDLAIRYVYYFVKSFLLPKCLRISMEGMIQYPNITVKQVADFLKVEDIYMQGWWDKVGKQEDNNKKLHKWWERHTSAVIEPKHLDIEVDIKEHSFWSDILPVFDKYYNNLNSVFEDNAIIDDINYLISLSKKWNKVSANELYNTVSKLTIRQ